MEEEVKIIPEHDQSSKPHPLVEERVPRFRDAGLSPIREHRKADSLKSSKKEVEP